MEEFTQLFGSLLAFVYHCFDRIVIHGYLSGRRDRNRWFISSVRFWTGRWSAKKCSANAPAITRTGWRPTPAIITSPSNGRKRECAKKITSHRASVVWSRKTTTESISSSRVWNRAGLSASVSRNIPPRTPTTASWRTNASVSPITTSTSGMRGAARGLLLSLSRHLLAQRPFLHRARTAANPHRLPQKRQRLSRRRRRGRPAGSGRPAESAAHPQTAGLLDFPAGTEVLQKRTCADELVPLLRPVAD